MCMNNTSTLRARLHLIYTTVVVTWKTFVDIRASQSRKSIIAVLLQEDVTLNDGGSDDKSAPVIEIRAGRYGLLLISRYL